MEDEVIQEYIEILESLLEDMPYKPKEELKRIINEMKKSKIDSEFLLKIQDDLEAFSATSNIDSFTRNEIMNIISDMELLIQN
jgi:phosphopantothenate synthetase